MLLEERRVGVATASGALPLEKEEEEEEGGGGDAELECGICCMPYDRCGRAPRRLGGARGSWKPSRCRHVICSACVCRLAREGWWEEVTCPYCRAVTSLRERRSPWPVAGVRRGGARRRLVLPPVDAELWHRVARLEEEEEEGRRGAPCEEAPGPPSEAEEEDEEEEEAAAADGAPRRLWRALKRLLKGGGGGREAQARGRRGPGRSRSLPPRRRTPLMHPCGSEMKDLALMTCYII